MHASSQQQPLSISELNRRARQLLEVHLDQVWVVGEISNLTMHSSGHWYFSLKDSRAQLRCAMFRGDNSRLRFKPQHGMQVLVRGRVSLYEGRGDYQLIVEHMLVAGTGDLQAAFEQLKTKLAAEGLFDDVFKQSLPTLPRHVAIVSSPQAAALHDILTAFRRRNPNILLSIAPVAVQGAQAAPDIARALHALNQAECHPPLDAIIIARGGGSLEDLWAFNEEIVARAIFASDIPIVSGVGHETDFSIADFVADVRAPTPTAAAELLSPPLADLRSQVDACQQRFTRQIRLRLQNGQRELDHLRKRLQHPSFLLRESQQQLDWLQQRLLRSLREQRQSQQRQLAHLTLRLHHCEPQTQLARLHARLLACQPRLVQAQQRTLEQRQSTLTPLQQRLFTSIKPALTQPKQRLLQASKLLQAVSPLQTLERGYAIALDEKQQSITDANSVIVGSRIQIRLQRGQLACRVEATETEHSQ